jgi:hypothetical protein
MCHQDGCRSDRKLGHGREVRQSTAGRPERFFLALKGRFGHNESGTDDKPVTGMVFS